MSKNPDKLLPLFLTFMKIGVFTFGGGYAMIPLVQKEVCEKHSWISDKDILDIVAIAESTPGPIAVNAATFVGYKICGFWGAFLSTVGVVLPSFVIVSVITLVLRQFQSIKTVQYAFNGIRAGVLALIIRGLVSMYNACPHSAASYAVMGAAFICVAILNINVVFVLIGCALAGLGFSAHESRRARK